MASPFSFKLKGKICVVCGSFSVNGLFSFFCHNVLYFLTIHRDFVEMLCSIAGMTDYITRGGLFKFIT